MVVVVGDGMVPLYCYRCYAGVIDDIDLVGGPGQEHQ